MFRNFIARQFKRPSGLFGNYSSKIMFKGNRHKYETLIHDMNIQPGNQILEIGYGPGLGIHMISHSCESCTIDGVDFSKLMHQKARRYNKPMIDAGKVHLQHGDYLSLAFVPGQYDKIYCINVIYFWDELSAPFEKTLSLLKTDGAFHIFMFDIKLLIEKKAPDEVFNKYSLEHVVTTLATAGFSQIEHHFDKGHYITAKK